MGSSGPAPGVRLRGTGRIDGAVLFAPLTLDLVPGGWTCLLGGSGIGKSTLLRLIAALPTGARFDGSITASDGQPLAGRIAYMAQDDLLLPWLDVTGNVLLGATLRGTEPPRSAARDLIDRVGLAPHATKRPAELSGGQRQRVALARALIEDRPVVLLDEPFSALDARLRADLQDLAARMLAGRTVLIVTHDPAEAARLGHRIELMTASGLQRIPAPPSPPIRDAGADETLHFQADLLTRMRQAA